MHNTRAFLKLNHPRYVQARLGWLKLVTGSDEYVGDVPLLLANGITPIIRLYEPKFGASQVTSDQLNLTTLYVGAGARWFEFYNEPNLPLEWSDTIQPDYNNLSNVIAPLMDHWLQWAELVITLGGYPAFPALAETTGQYQDVTSWLKAMMNYLATKWYDRFRTVANSGLWCATHPYFYNHFYQEAGSPKSARPPEAQVGTDGGWHFEYPYDPITQANDPGRSVLDPSAGAPSGDPIGLTGMGQAFMQLFVKLFGGGAVPVVGTEGGITPLPTPGSLTQTDTRFPPFTWASHGEATLACFNWIANQAPPWMFGLTLWKEDAYWGDSSRQTPGNVMLAVNRLSAVPPMFKPVPPIEALAGPGPGPANRTPVPGPGPLHGEPDYHFIVLSPDFDASWLFTSAHDYWDRFRPALVTNIDLVGIVPGTKSLAVTALCTPAQANALAKSILALGPNVYLDLLAPATPDELIATLTTRVASGRRFG
jgi:hypothetical protein